MFAPSVFAHMLNGFFLVAAFITFYLNRKYIWQLNSYKFLLLVLIASIAAGLHGLSHLGLEAVYGYNPMKLFFMDDSCTCKQMMIKNMMNKHMMHNNMMNKN